MVKAKVISFQRCLSYHVKENVIASYVHGFCDASNLAYCASIHFVYESETGMYVKLMTSKTRVAPLKPMTIPRLELMSARVLTSLVSKVRRELEEQVETAEFRYWSDSKTALCWIDNRGEWKQFVRHRVNKMLKVTEKAKWGHCPGKENPVDLGTRGVTTSKLQESDLWWHGPDWLREPNKGWPERRKIEQTQESQQESTKIVVSTVKAVGKASIENVIDIQRVSSKEKFGRVTAWVQRFVQNYRHKVEGKSGLEGQLTVEEISSAEKFWIQAVQEGLRQKASFSQLVMPLGLVTNEGGLYCKGRLGASDLSLEAQQP